MFLCVYIRVCLCVCVYKCGYICVCVCRTNNVEDHVVEQNSGLKIDNLSSVSGKELFKNSQYLVHTHTHTHAHLEKLQIQSLYRENSQ